MKIFAKWLPNLFLSLGMALYSTCVIFFINLGVFTFTLRNIENQKNIEYETDIKNTFIQIN